MLFLFSIIPLYLLKFDQECSSSNLKIVKTFKQIPKSDIYLFGSYELLNVVKFLITMYIFIYIKNTYQMIGMINFITNFSLMIFTYLFGKNLDKSKRNFLPISIFLTVVVYAVKINIEGYLLLIISFIEGFITKMYELTV